MDELWQNLLAGQCGIDRANGEIGMLGQRHGEIRRVHFSSCQRLGAPIEAANKEVALSEVAREPKKYASAPFVTTGTVSAVCQHMGCWMELKDDAGQAHIKMAGHAFFVPKTASGKKARVAGTVIAQETGDGCGEGHQGHGESGKKGCKAEAEAQLGRPLAKLELVATGVEILD